MPVPGLDPGIVPGSHVGAHIEAPKGVAHRGVDGRDKPGHDVLWKTQTRSGINT